MLSIDINHPDSPEFILSKQDLTKITGANISVKLNDEFMTAVEKDEDYFLTWPTTFKVTTKSIQESSELNNFDLNQKIDNAVKYNVLYSGKDHYYKKVKAKELWDSIVTCAWSTAEPGILFWNNILDNDPASVYPEFKAISTNPLATK